MKALAARTEEQTLIPGTHMMERINFRKLFSDLHRYAEPVLACTYTDTYRDTINVKKLYFIYKTLLFNMDSKLRKLIRNEKEI